MLEQLVTHLVFQMDERVEREEAAREDVCTGCKKRTRLMTGRVKKRFKILFVPVLRYSERVVVDRCQDCGKSALELEPRVWERLRSAGHSAAGHAHGADTRERWLDELSMRQAFGEEEPAEELALMLATHAGSSARVQAHLAWARRWKGHAHSAREAESAARATDPREPALAELDVRRALEAGDPVRALSYLGRGHERAGELRQGTLRALGRALFAAERWRELHDLLATLLPLFPHLAYDADVRRAVRRTNRKLDGVRTIVLPRLPGEFKVRRRLVGATVVILILAAVAEFTARQFRPVVFVASEPRAYHFRVNGEKGEVLTGTASVRHDLAYGRHRIAVHGARMAQIQLEIAPRGFLAILDDTLHVVDLSGGSVLCIEDKTRGAPRELLFGADTYSMAGPEQAFGQRFHPTFAIENFRDPAGRVTLWSGSSADLAIEEAAAGRETRALELLEDAIAHAPAARDLFQPYAWIARKAGLEERAGLTLAKPLAERPLRREAHIAALLLIGSDAEAAGRGLAYAAELDAGPPDAAAAAVLRELVARLVRTRKEGLAWAERALAADPDHAVAHAIAADLLAGVDWPRSLDVARRGLERFPHDAFLLDIRGGALLALGRADELERELRAELEQHPRHEERLGRLAELLVARGRATELDLFVGSVERARGDKESARRARHLRSLALEAGGRLEELAASPRDESEPDLSRWQLLAFAELGRGRDFDQRVAREGRLVDQWYDALVLALCFELAGDEQRAAHWHATTLERLLRFGGQGGAAELLRGERAATVAAVEELALGSHGSAVVLLAAAVRHPESREELLRAAERFHPWPGHVQRLIGRLRTGP